LVMQISWLDCSIQSMFDLLGSSVISVGELT
jgi:hypothetical protein